MFFAIFAHMQTYTDVIPTKTMIRFAPKAILHVILTTLLLLSSTAMWAQTRVITSVEEALSLAHQARPDIYLLTEAQRKLEATALDLPKLQVSTQYGQTNGVYRDYGISIEQSIPFPTIFALKRKLLKASTSKALAQQRLAEQELDRSVKSCYYKALFLRERLSLAHHLDSLYTQLLLESCAGGQAGKAHDVDQGLSEERCLQQSMLVSSLELEQQQTLERLALLLGIEGAVDLKPSERIHLLALPAQAEPRALPQYRLAEAEAVELKAEGRLEAADVLPEITLEYSNQGMTGKQDYEDGSEVWVGPHRRFHAVTLGLSIPLNLGASKAKVKAYALRQRAQSVALKRLEAELKHEAQQLLLSYTHHVQAYKRYQEVGIPRAERLMHEAHRTYLENKSNYLELSASIEAYVELKRQALEELYQANERVLALEYLSSQTE